MNNAERASKSLHILKTYIKSHQQQKISQTKKIVKIYRFTPQD